MQREFKSGADFRKSLEAKLYAKAREMGEELERIRRKVAFERLLVRLYSSPDYEWILKGGHALELRFQTARATKDVDLMVGNFGALSDDLAQLTASLREAASLDLKDYFEYRVGEVKRQLAGPLYGGGSYPVESRIDGRRFVAFQVDVGLGDVTCEPIEILQQKGWLADYGFPPICHRLANTHQQFAEKLHAYTAPSDNRSNSRVKDLVDMILLIRHHRLGGPQLKAAIDQVFRQRNTHQLPPNLTSPPFHWPIRFATLAEPCGLSLSCKGAFDELSAFLEEGKVLG